MWVAFSACTRTHTNVHIQCIYVYVCTCTYTSSQHVHTCTHTYMRSTYAHGPRKEMHSQIHPYPHMLLFTCIQYLHVDKHLTLSVSMSKNLICLPCTFILTHHLTLAPYDSSYAALCDPFSSTGYLLQMTVKSERSSC